MTAPSTLQRVRIVLASRACPRDPPGTKRKAQHFQVPADRIRSLSQEYLIKIIGLVPDPEWHDTVIRQVVELVVGGEAALIAALEGSPEWRAAGYTLKVGPPPRDPADPEPEADPEADRAEPYIDVPDV